MTDPASSPSFQILRECDDQWSAVAIQTLLSSDKIESHLTGTDAATALGLGGAPTDALIKIHVDEQDLGRAQEVLRIHEELIQRGKPWECPRCREPNDATFEVCWNCKAHNTDARTDEPWSSGDDETPRASLAPMTVGTEQPPLNVISSNPYEPTAMSRQAFVEGQIEDTEENAVRYESAVRQALLISVVSVLVVPPFLFPVACWMLLRLPRRPPSLAYPAVRIRAAWAFAALSLATGFFFLRLGLVPFALF